MCPALLGFSQSAPSGSFCLCVSWCSSQLACHIKKHTPSGTEYAQTCLFDFGDCTVASLSRLTKQVLVRKAVWISVCMYMQLFMLVFAYAVHLITSAGKVSAPALRGVQFPEEYSDPPSSKN